MNSNSIDKRNKLGEEIFTYQITKSKKILISWHGKQVTTLSGRKAVEKRKNLSWLFQMQRARKRN